MPTYVRAREPKAPRAVVRPLPFTGDDAALVAAIRAGHPGATAALFDRHATHVRRVLARVLGADPDLSDLLHDVFVRALDGVDRLEDPAALQGWLTSIAVYTARGCIRRRQARRWLRIVAPEEVPEVEANQASVEVTEALRAAYALLDRMSADDRIPFALRFIDGMELTEVAAACGVSLATIKRRLTRAQTRFTDGARKTPALAEWLRGGEGGER